MLSANSFLSASSRPCQHGQTRPDRTYGLSKASLCLVSTPEGVSITSDLLFCSEREIVEGYYMLKDAVLEEGCVPFRKAHGGVGFFDLLHKIPTLSALFNQVMAATSKILVEQMLRVYKGFEDVKELMDVGGGIGASLHMILSKYPHIRGINFDLPNVVSHASKCPAPGLEHVGGDMFESLPAAQIILLKWVLHDWDDDKCKKLLENCWKALPKEGKVIVAEYVVPEDEVIGDNLSEMLNLVTADFHMMAWFGSKERTLTEFQHLATAAGFVQLNIFPIVDKYHVLEFYKTTSG